MLTMPMDISQKYIFTDRHTLHNTESVDMLLHVTTGKLICPDNNPAVHWVAIRIHLH
jgi:hypothetical protein